MKFACNSGYQEQGAHASDEHHAADDHFTDEGELSREPHGEPACGIGAHDFEEYLEERTGVFGIACTRRDFGAEENQRGARDDYDSGDENSNSLVYGVVRDGASENLGLFPAEEPVDAEKEDDRSRCNLDAAATATGVCPDEHDDDKDEKRCVRKVGNVDGVEPCRAARKSHEQDGLCVFAKGVTAKQVVPFGERENRSTCGDDDNRADCRKAGVQGDASDGLALEVEDIAQFRNGKEAESACKYEDAGGDVHDRVVLETDERVGEQREPHTAEGADRLE